MYYIIQALLKTGEIFMGGDIGLMWDTLYPLIIIGITVGVVAAVIAGAIKLGWQLAPWIVGLSLLVWFFG